MAVHYDFLGRLGLGPEADARAVRRAYARELKLIDQERDPAGFQRLRACYEAAVEWAASQEEPGRASEADWERPGGTAAVHAAAPAAPAAAPPEPAADALEPAAVPEAPEAAPSPFELGRQVFGAFCARMPALLELAGEPPELPWIEALYKALADERLLNLDGRLGFELHVAWLLSGGWRQGHEILLPAAAQVFGWDADRRSLARLGDAGARLDVALEQRRGFGVQDRSTRGKQRAVLALLRRDSPPADRLILRNMPVLEQMMTRFPQWMALIAPLDNVRFWRRRYQEKKGRPFEARAAKPRSTPVLGSRSWWLWWLVPGLFSALGHLFSNQPPRIDPSPQIINLNTTRETPAQHSERLRHPKPIYEDERPPQDRLQEISTRIHYKPGQQVKPGVLTVRYSVFLDADGSVLGMNRLSQSADPAFDAAVRKAIMESRPFPPKTDKVFPVEYSVTIGRAKKVVPVLSAGDRQFTRKRAPWEPPATNTPLP
jgi:protein TonB